MISFLKQGVVRRNLKWVGFWEKMRLKKFSKYQRLHVLGHSIWQTMIVPRNFKEPIWWSLEINVRNSKRWRKRICVGVHFTNIALLSCWNFWTIKKWLLENEIFALNNKRLFITANRYRRTRLNQFQDSFTLN